MAIHQVAVFVTIQRTPSLDRLGDAGQDVPGRRWRRIVTDGGRRRADRVDQRVAGHGVTFRPGRWCSRSGRRSRRRERPSRRRAGPPPASRRRARSTSIRVAASTVVPSLPGPGADDVGGRGGRGARVDAVGDLDGVAAAGWLARGDVRGGAELGVGGGSVCSKVAGRAGDLAADRRREDRRSPLGGGAHADVDRRQQRAGRGVGEPRPARRWCGGARPGGDRQRMPWKSVHRLPVGSLAAGLGDAAAGCVPRAWPWRRWGVAGGGGVLGRAATGHGAERGGGGEDDASGGGGRGGRGAAGTSRASHEDADDAR